MIIYVSGPLSAPTAAARLENVESAIRAGLAVMGKGHTPLIPHLTHFVEALATREQTGVIEYEHWLRMDFEILDRCDALLYLGPSPGADRERARALAQGKPVFTDVEEIPPC